MEYIKQYLTKNNMYSWPLGLGIASFAFRNPWMQLGLLVSCMILICVFLADNGYRKKLSLGSKWIYIPLIIIVLSMIGSCIVRYFDNGNFTQLIGSSFMAIYFFALYLVARILGKEIFRPFAFIVILEAISVVVIALISGGKTGGFASEVNYNIATGLLAFGSIISVIKRQWIIVSIGTIGLLFTGSEEGIIAIGILLVAVLFRKDVSLKLLIPVGLVILVFALGFYPFHYSKQLYINVIDKGYMLIFKEHSPFYGEYWAVEPSEYDSMGDYYLDNRVKLFTEGMDKIEPLGTGYNLLPGYFVPHNIPLIIVYQIGILGALAWLFLTFYCLIKTRWKYAFITVLALSLFDNYMWAQVGLWWWVLIGVATTSTIESDLIFRRKQLEGNCRNSCL
jgi:hypothetical protein